MGKRLGEQVWIAYHGGVTNVDLNEVGGSAEAKERGERRQGVRCLVGGWGRICFTRGGEVREEASGEPMHGE